MNLHIYPSAFRHESRILRITKSLAQAGFFSKIYIAAVWENGLEETEMLDGSRTVWRARLWTKRLPSLLGKATRHLEWALRVAAKFLVENLEVVNCHSLTVLPLGVFFKLLTGCILVYDPHELETETAGLSGVRQRISRWTERLLIPLVDATVVVNESIAAWYRSRYGLKRVAVIRNFPETPPNSNHPGSLRERIGLRQNDLLFLYLGLLDVGRGISVLLEVFSRLEDKHILFLGYGPLRGALEEKSKKYNNIHYLNAVPPNEIIGCARQADIGVSLIEDLCLSYHYALPNKIFEYINAGLPVIVSDLPEMATLIDDHRCGWKIACNEAALDSLIRGLSREEVREKAANAAACRGRFDWCEEEKTLRKLYEGIVPAARKRS